ncbi:MAG: hypothetical protein AAGI91_14335 [Bacteroidota bacterium]
MTHTSTQDPALLTDAFGTSDPVMLLDLVRSMEGQLAELYGGAAAQAEAEERPADLPTLYAAVGVTSATELTDLVRSMEEQLAALYDAPAD